MTNRSKTAGFTLIELIVTVAILTLLAGVLVPAVGSYMEKSKKSKAATELRTLVDVFSAYHLDTGSWPNNADLPVVATTSFAVTGMPCLYTNALTKNGWDGPYMGKGVMNGVLMNIAIPVAGVVPASGLLDSWGRPYQCYTFANAYQATAGGVVVLSFGANGVLDSSLPNVFAGTPTGDDLTSVVTYLP